MNELQKYMLMLQGGYKPQDGAITSDQMQGFKNAGLLNKTVALENQIQDTNNLINSLNIPKEPIQVPNTADEDLLKKQQRGNMLMALGDLLRGKDATAGFTQRQAQFDAQREVAERKAKQEEMLASMTPEQRKIYELYGPQAAFNYKYNKPERKTIEGADGYRYFLDGSRVLPNVTAPEEPAKRDSFVAKDGYRYYVDDNTRVFPGVTVTEEQSEEDLYKENAAKIKNTILTKGKDALTENQLAFYDDYMKNKGFMNIEQAIASQMFGNNNTNDSIGSNTSNENIVQDGKTYVYSRTQADGSKVYVNGGKEYVFQD